MINRVNLIGRLTRDPELRTTGNGISVTNFTIAVNRQYKNQNGEREADFISIVAWQKLAELVCNYMTKGRLVAVEGRIQTRNYENERGERVYITEVVAESVQFLDRAENGTASNQNSNTNGNQNRQNQGQDPKQNQNSFNEPAAMPETNDDGLDLFKDLPF
jgi:single-strand DNA-binding protein